MCGRKLVWPALGARSHPVIGCTSSSSVLPLWATSTSMFEARSQLPSRHSRAGPAPTPRRPRDARCCLCCSWLLASEEVPRDSTVKGALLVAHVISHSITSLRANGTVHAMDFMGPRHKPHSLYCPVIHLGSEAVDEALTGIAQRHGERGGHARCTNQLWSRGCSACSRSEGDDIATRAP